MSELKYSTPSSLYGSSTQKSTPGSGVSTKSLMHAGHSVSSSSQRSIVQEKNSPVNATPPEFKRVHITPVRMDSLHGDASTYDAILKRVSEKVSINEQKTFLKNVGSMFDDDEDHSEDGSDAQAASVTVMDYGIGNPIKEITPEKSDENEAHFESPANKNEDADNNNEHSSGEEFPASNSSNSNWLNLLATAASLVYDDLQTAAVNNSSNINPSAIASSRNYQSSVSLSNKDFSSAAAPPIEEAIVSFAKINQPSYSSSSQYNKANSYIAKDKLEEILPEYKAHLDFLREVDKEFFPNHDEPQRLLQRYLLLSVESVRGAVFTQHDEFVAQGIFAKSDV